MIALMSLVVLLCFAFVLWFIFVAVGICAQHSRSSKSSEVHCRNLKKASLFNIQEERCG
jgi:hypothetical protein